MGRSRVLQSGETRPADLGRRKTNRAEHGKHHPNPNKLLSTAEKLAGGPFTPGKQATSPSMRALNERRLIIVADASRLEILSILPTAYQLRLTTPITGTLRPLEEGALAEQLDTIQMVLLRHQSRAACIALRNQLQIIIRDEDVLAPVILASLKYDIDEDIASMRPNHCDERSKHFAGVLAKFQPATI